jgi:hypothetical protein
VTVYAIAVLTNLVLVIVLAGWLVRTRNRLDRLGNNVDAAWAQVQVQLARREALAPTDQPVTEDKIAYSRQFYNIAVQRYNDAIGSFPGSLVAGRRRRPLPYFDADLDV